MCGHLLHTPYWGMAYNPGMGPDWELNSKPFGSQAGTQLTEPHQPGPNTFIFITYLDQFLNFI